MSADDGHRPVVARMTQHSAEIVPVGYTRDASAYNHPNVTSAKRVHLDAGDGSTRCSGAPLVTDSPIRLLDLRHDDALCRRCFPDAGMGHPLALVVLGARWADLWNERHPVGTPVTFWAGARIGDGLPSTTRSTAWVVGGMPVVSVEGYAGGIALTHIEPHTPPGSVES